MSNFNGWSISNELFDWIRNNVKDGSTILELGSGRGTIELCKHYNMFSIEHDKKYLNKSESTYIHAPIKDGWYDIDFFKLPKEYSLLLVDGPTGSIGRSGLLKNLDLFHRCIIIIDDTQRKEEYDLYLELCKIYDKEINIIENDEKSFGIIN